MVAQVSGGVQISGHVQISGQVQISGGVSLVKPVYEVGESVEIDGKFEVPPNFDGGLVSWEARPDDPASANRAMDCAIRVARGSTNFSAACQLSLDAPPGPWHVVKVTFAWGDSHQVVLSDKRIDFEVKSRSDLLIPKSAEVALNPTHIQLFRGEARAVQLQIEDLKSRLNDTHSNRSAAEAKILIDNVELAVSKLQDTESRFLKLDPSASQANAGKIFFEDLQRNYQIAQTDINRTKAKLADNSAHVILASQVASKAYSPLAQVVLRALEQNELAYASVADSGSLYFNLRVESEPPGATITFKRRGDPSYQSTQDTTNSTLQNIPKAITLIHYHLAGWHDTEKEFNPFTAAEDVVSARLSK